MDYRYRVIGVAKSAFILRGRHFRIGGGVEAHILESELAFVKEHCELTEIIDNAMPSQSYSIPKNPTTSPRGGVKNELPKSTSRANKSADTSKV